MKRVTRDHVIYAMDKANPPVAVVQPGERLLVETEDCFSGQIKEATKSLGVWFDYSRINPATGPIEVVGANPGDVLEVVIEEIVLPRQGVMATYPGWGPLGSDVRESMVKIVPIEGARVLFSSDISLPVRPMIGVIGTAPSGKAVPCGSPGPHGGNLDTKEITCGTRVFLPVFVPEALLALGDVHATMADGEVCGTAVECRAEVLIRVELHFGLHWKTPHLIREEHHYVLASGATLEEAIQLATRETVEMLAYAQGLSWNEAYMLASLACDLQISQVVNPLKTVRVKIPSALLPHTPL
ncbi:MAG: acetamidase/formamidase family protein [Candidatus Bipolaricaulota bacterium]|nr:acetamidase/formamidase family protein [Candidatus Bipolaricaulota bacterium]MDW8126790.1 acetamidase/formamidase family protein [Candidatus Bipolaricaulota bacterium]